MKLSGETKTCCNCGNEMPKERMFDYCVTCGKNKPKEGYVWAGFGTKGNGAHIRRSTHGEK